MTFTDDFVTIHHGDAWELAPTLAPQSVHTIVTSPPSVASATVHRSRRLPQGLSVSNPVRVQTGAHRRRCAAPAVTHLDRDTLNVSGRNVCLVSGKRQDNARLLCLDAQERRERSQDSRGSAVRRLVAEERTAVVAVGLLGVVPAAKRLREEADRGFINHPNLYALRVSAALCSLDADVPFAVNDTGKRYELAASRVLPEDDRYKPRLVRGAGAARNADGLALRPKAYKHEGDVRVGREAIANANRVWTDAESLNTAVRNRRSVWTIPTRPFSQAHFAVFPPDLIKPCILAGAPEKCCPECGAPWERQVERESHVERERGKDASSYRALGQPQQAGVTTTTTRGFAPSCDHGHEPIGGTVLDPFMGSGTTAMVARSLGRKSIGFELNADYIEIAAKHRLAQGVLL